MEGASEVGRRRGPTWEGRGWRESRNGGQWGLQIVLSFDPLFSLCHDFLLHCMMSFHPSASLGMMRAMGSEVVCGLHVTVRVSVGLWLWLGVSVVRFGHV